MTSEDLKTQGNAAFSSGDYQKAIDLFSQAISADPNNHVLYSNRSASFASLKDYQKALDDAEKAIQCNSSWAKGYSRKGAALFGLGKYADAEGAYSEGLKYDPSNAQLKKGLEDAKSASKPMNPLASLFQGDIYAKLAGNPKLSSLLADQDFMRKLAQVQQQPDKIGEYLQDPRMMQVLSALMGINVMSGDQFADENGMQMPMDEDEKADDKWEVVDPPVPEPVADPEPEPMEPDNKELAKAEKDLGNAAYKKKSFDEALKHYSAASELDPADITILNNTGAVYFEMGKYDECIKISEEAIEKGREHRADYKHIARAYGRIGSSYSKKDDLDSAIKFYQKSLAETRTADILEKLKDTEKLKLKRDRDAYQDPAKADESRNLGNDLFKQGKFADAVPHYSESIKRAESDPRGYSNRAACYSKLMALPEALRDCEKAIQLDKNFVKAYIRKAAVEHLMKEYVKAMATCDEALVIDAEHNGSKSQSEINQQKQRSQMASYGYGENDESMSQEERAAKAMKDPKVQEIMSDPVMRQILDQMAKDPGAARDHLSNPLIREKIQILTQAGIIGFK